MLVLTQRGPSTDSCTLTLFFRGDLAHTGFHNIQFSGPNQLLVAEDAGDTLHTQPQALDSGYLLGIRVDHGTAANQPLRFLAEGREASATLDSALSARGHSSPCHTRGAYLGALSAIAPQQAKELAS